MSSYFRFELLELILLDSGQEGLFKLELGLAHQTLNILFKVKLHSLLRTIEDVHQVTDAHQSLIVTLGISENFDGSRIGDITTYLEIRSVLHLDNGQL